MFTSILHLEVTDDDLDPNAGPFTLDIIDGNQNNEFRIGKNNSLITAAQFNRQIKDTYNLTIRAFDNGSPTLYTDTVITVMVIEESAFPPIATPLISFVSALECTFTGGLIGRVKAIDRDIYDTLHFGLVPSDNSFLFTIDPLDGTLQAAGPLDDGEYLLNVSVSDGKHMVYTSAQLNVECVTADMAANAVVVRFHHMLPEEFLTSHVHAFQVSSFK